MAGSLNRIRDLWGGWKLQAAGSCETTLSCFFMEILSWFLYLLFKWWLFTVHLAGGVVNFTWFNPWISITQTQIWSLRRWNHWSNTLKRTQKNTFTPHFFWLHSVILCYLAVYGFSIIVLPGHGRASVSSSVTWRIHWFPLPSFWPADCKLSNALWFHFFPNE